MKITEYSIINFCPYTMVDLTDWCWIHLGSCL